MNQLFIYILLLIIITKPFSNHFGQTYLWTRPSYSLFTIQQNLWFDLVFGKSCKKSFQIIGLAQKTNHQNKNINKYFFFNTPETIVTSENAKISSTERLRSQWLGLGFGLEDELKFEGKFNINPEESRKGFLAMWRIDKTDNRRITFLNNSWICITLPFEYVKHELNTNYISENKADLILALNQFKYSKLKQNTKSIGFTELRLELGFDFFSEEKLAAFFSTFLGIPLASKQSGINLFEATRGYGKNIIWGGSLYSTFLLNCSDYSQIRFFLGMQNIYLIPDNQYRTLNLFAKPVSRYVRLVNKNGEKNIPGIDIFTQYCKISPYNIGDITAGFIFELCDIKFLINYGLWTKGHERVELINPWPQDYWGIDAQKEGQTIDNFPLTASMSSASFLATPDQNLNGDNIFIPIQNRDLDLISAASRGTIVHRIEYSIGYEFNKKNKSTIFSLGSYYEFQQNNCALASWGLWSKMGFNF